MRGGMAERALTFYRERVLPPLLDRVMRSRELASYRAQLVPGASGRVLEIGIGSALNLPFYGRAVREVIGLDPSARLLVMARRRVTAGRYPVQLLQASAQCIPLDDASIDVAISTWTLCSVPDIGQALAETHRVLRPGGRLLFVEHGLAPDRRVRAWQRRLAPAWAVIGGGCRLDRPMAELVEAAGFQIETLQTGYMPGPKPMTFLYQGCARRR
jgi:ubiquinone/menaquinone biosynthesis C-methylase UbiE